MIIDPFAFLIARRRARDANLGSEDILKASLIGTAAGGSSPAARVLLADRLIKRTIETRRPDREPSDDGDGQPSRPGNDKGGTKRS